MKDWELLTLIGGAVAIGLVVETNNPGTFRRIISGLDGYAVANPTPMTPETYPSNIISSANPSISKSETQKKRQEMKKNKKARAEIPNTGVHSVEYPSCPDDLSKVCGSNCTKNNRLYKIVCSQWEENSLFPAVVPEKHGASLKETREIMKQYPSITVPPNFPGSVTVTPSREDQNEPYLPDESESQGPPLIPKPGKTLKQPTDNTLTPSKPSTRPTTSPPPSGNIIGYLDKIDEKRPGINSIGCYPGHLKSGGDRPSCRGGYNGDISNRQQYGIIATPVVGGNRKNTAHGGSLQTEITSGGPVSKKAFSFHSNGSIRFKFDR
jgi:hypothetical protein